MRNGKSLYRGSRQDPPNDSPPGTPPPPTVPGEDERRRVLLFMLEDLEEERRKIEQAQREWTLAFDAIHDPVFIHDANYRIVRANRAYAGRAVRDFADIVGRPYWEVFPRRSGPLPLCRIATEDRLDAATEEFTLDTGETFVSRAFAMRDARKLFLYAIHVLEDVTERRKAEADRRILSAALQQAAEAIMIADATAHIRYVNPAFCRLFGYASAEVAGQPVTLLAVPGAQTVQPDEAVRITRAGDDFCGEVVRRTRDGTPIPVQLSVAAIRNAAGEVEGFIGTMTDLRAIKRAEEALREMATHDGLTGLYNHRMFYKMLEDELARAKRFDRPMSLLLLDIDHFKRVNDEHGHLAGDAILRDLSDLMVKQARAIDRVCRYGGEEITMILPETDADGAANIAERLRAAVANEVFGVSGGKRLGITVSIGVAAYPAQADTPDKLVAAADNAMYAAKLAGRNGVKRYTPPAD